MTQHNNQKRPYEKPTMTIHQLNQRQRLLVGSDPNIPLKDGPSPYQW